MSRRVVLVAAGTVVSMCAVAWSFHLARHEVGFYELPFIVFWVGFAAGLLPVWCVAAGRAGPQWALPAVVVAGLLTTWPKVLRTWSAPLFSDEFGHLYQTKRVIADGLFPPGENPLLKVAPEFPLLHWLTAALSRTGLDLWVSASIVAAAAHVATLLAVYALVRLVTNSSRAGALGALFYTLQPGWLFFSAQFAYETLALPLLAGTVALALWARTRSGRPRIWALAGVVIGSGLTALTHHFASATLAAFLLASLVFALRDQRFHPRRGDVFAVTAAVAVIGVWLASRYLALADYYGPTFESTFDRFRGTSEGSSTRQAFAGSQVPTFERWAGYVFPFALFGLYLRSVVAAWPRLRSWRIETLLVLLGGSFFVTLPLILTTAGSEPAHRWWAYAYLGLAAVLLLPSTRPARPTSRVRSLGLAAALVVVAVGGAAAGTTVGYRFPGPAEIGNDARSVSPEAQRVAYWLEGRFGPAVDSDLTVLADRYTAQQLVGYGLQRTSRPSRGYPAWDLLYSADPETLRRLAPMLDDDRVGVVVVDTRMTTDRPVLGYWFNRDEPGAFGDVLVEAPALAKFDCAAWSERVFTAGHLAVYAVDPALLSTAGEVCS